MTAISIEERQNWIGSSESAILFNCSPYGTPFTLWHEKAGNVPPETLDHLERVQAGKHLEPAIAAWAGEKWPGWRPRKSIGYLTHPDVAQMGASLDFEDGTGGLGANCPPIEIKNVDWLVFRDNWVVEGETIIDAPLHFLVQVQHQLACRPKADHGWLLVCVGGNKLYRKRIERHPGVITKIERTVAKFWQSIRDETEPKADFETDGPTIAALYGKGNGEILDLAGNNRMPALCNTYITAKAVEKQAKKNADTALAEIKSIIGAAPGATCAGYSIKAADIAEGEGKAFTRPAYRRWYVKEQKEAA